jgi:flap endonuclease-1
LKWRDCDEEGLLQYLVKERGFGEDRVKAGIEKLKKSRTGSVQGRLTSFFGEPTVVKRKREETTSSAKNKKGKIDAKGKTATKKPTTIKKK